MMPVHAATPDGVNFNRSLVELLKEVRA